MNMFAVGIVFFSLPPHTWGSSANLLHTTARACPSIYRATPPHCVLVLASEKPTISCEFVMSFESVVMWFDWSWKSQTLVSLVWNFMLSSTAAFTMCTICESLWKMCPPKWVKFYLNPEICLPHVTWLELWRVYSKKPYDYPHEIHL